MLRKSQFKKADLTETKARIRASLKEKRVLITKDILKIKGIVFETADETELEAFCVMIYLRNKRDTKANLKLPDELVLKAVRYLKETDSEMFKRIKTRKMTYLKQLEINSLEIEEPESETKELTPLIQALEVIRESMGLNRKQFNSYLKLSNSSYRNWAVGLNLISDTSKEKVLKALNMTEDEVIKYAESLMRCKH